MARRSSQQSDCMQSALTNMSVVASNLSNVFQQPEQPSHNSSDSQLLCQKSDGKKVQLFKDPLTQASSSLDGEIKLPSQHHSNDHDQLPLLPNINPEFPNQEKKTLPEYYRFNRTTEEHKSCQWDDAMNTSIMATEHSNEASKDDKPITFGTENCTFSDSVTFLSNSSEWIDLTEDGQNISSEDEAWAEEYCTVNAEASSSASCRPSWPSSDQGTHKREFTCEGCSLSNKLSKLNVKNIKCEVSSISFHVSQTVDACSDFRACFTSTQTTEITQDFVVKRCQDVSTSTHFFSVNQETQTNPRLTTGKSTITEVCMTDLDAICEKFDKFRKMEEELLLLKDERSCAKKPRVEQQQCKFRCGAFSRAESAELRLLALQFSMCWQHCWRCFYTSLPVETLAKPQRFEEVLDAVSQTLKSLEKQYLKMKRKILEGVPLDNLKPLFVDTKRLKTETCYRPSLINEAFLDDHLSESSCDDLQNEYQINQDEVFKINATEHRLPNKNGIISQHESATSKNINSRQRQEGVSKEADPGVSKDFNSSDAWFDAKEYNVDANKKNESFLLSVSNLPNAVDEQKLLSWFAKYNTNQVYISNLNNTRVAVVSVRNPNDAEAAIIEMNGQSIEGTTLHVQHLHKPPADGQITIKESSIHLVSAAIKTGSAGEQLITQNIFVASGALHCSLDKITNISSTPTATGTCVPQQYGTMGSFDTIMCQLSERHTNVGRQQIINALLKLQTKNCGVLSGLPLGDIVNMTSELLTHSATD